MANCGRLVIEIAQWSQWTCYRKQPLIFRVTPTTSKLGSKMHHQDQLRDACLANRQGSCRLCRMSLWAKRCRLLPSYFGPCLSYKADA